MLLFLDISQVSYANVLEIRLVVSSLRWGFGKEFLGTGSACEGAGAVKVARSDGKRSKVQRGCTRLVWVTDDSEWLRQSPRRERRLLEGAGAPGPRVAVINADDEFGRKLLRMRSDSEIRTYGVEQGEWRGEGAAISEDGVPFQWRTPFGSVELQSPKGAEHSLHSLLAACTAAPALGMKVEQIASAIDWVNASPE